MSSLIEYLRAFFTKPEPHQPLSSGFYSYHTPEGEVPQYRLHLRIEKDGEGIMVVNASSVLHLNQTATEFAYLLMHGKSVNEVSEEISRRFKAPSKQIRKDVASFQEQIHNFIMRSDQEPITSFGFEPHLDIQDISAPYRLDCCLTYRHDESSQPAGELNTEDWRKIIQKSFEIGIPQLIFFGGEPTLRPDLQDLLASAEELGLVTGLVSNGPKLEDTAFVQGLITSGLDHLVFERVPDNSGQENALRGILPLDLYTCVEVNLDLEENAVDTIDQLASLGANAFSIHYKSQNSQQPYLRVLEHLEEAGLRLVSDNPVPLAGEPETAPASEAIPGPSAYVTLRVLPNGDVLCGDGSNIRMGNILHEDWKQIWDRRVTTNEIG